MNLRVTQTMLSNDMLRNLRTSYSKMQELQDQLSTGRRINRPSEDPMGTAQSMYFRTKIFEVETFQRNTNEAVNWMEMTDQALSKGNSVLMRIKELMVQASSDSWGTHSREAIAQELEQLKEHLGDVANTKLNDRYIFAGKETDKPPYQNGAYVGTNPDSIEVEIIEGSYFAINTNGSEVFSQGRGVFNVIDSMISDLRDYTKTATDISQHLGDLEEQVDYMVSAHSGLGARMTRVDQAIERLEVQKLSFQKYLSRNEDADLAKTITELTTQENIHRAALGAGARIIQPTLMDYLR